jgi:hypothetical protein
MREASAVIKDVAPAMYNDPVQRRAREAEFRSMDATGEGQVAVGALTAWLLGLLQTVH